MIDDLTIDALADAVQRLLRPRAMPYPDTSEMMDCTTARAKRAGQWRCRGRNKEYLFRLRPAYRYHASRPSAPRYAR